MACAQSAGKQAGSCRKDKTVSSPDFPGSWDLFRDIADITRWLDTSNEPSPHEDSMRVLKITEEAGEAASAYIGMVGQNPRKGVTHTLDDLLSELSDVVITALCAMQHFTQDAAVTRASLARKAESIISRSNISRISACPTCGANPGEPCISKPSGKLYGINHAKRVS